MEQRSIAVLPGGGSEKQNDVCTVFENSRVAVGVEGFDFTRNG